MTTIWISLGAAILIFVFGIIGLLLQKLLPEPHTTDRSLAMIGAIVGLFSLLLALVLGTLIGNAYAFYSVQKAELETFASRVVQLDLSLSEYGPETMPVRLKIKEALLKTHGLFWGQDLAHVDPEALKINVALSDLKAVDEYLASLTPQTNAQRQFAAAAGVHAALNSTNAVAPVAATGQSGFMAFADRGGVLGADPVLRIWAALAHQRHYGRRALIWRVRSGNRDISDFRAQRTLHRFVSSSAGGLRADARSAGGPTVGTRL